MSRVVKEPEVRKNEILSAARELFNTQGYAMTSVNGIIEKAGIAKGTFYYYFKSKEEVLDEIVKFWVSDNIKSATMIAQDNSLKAPEKLKRMIIEQNMEIARNHATLQHLHRIKNVDMHQKMIVETILQYAPVMTKVIEQGIAEGFFKNDCPLETIELILTGTQFLFDPGIFQWSDEQYAKKIKALELIMEGALNTPKGSFGYLSVIYKEAHISPAAIAERIKKEKSL